MGRLAHSNHIIAIAIRESRSYQRIRSLISQQGSAHGNDSRQAPFASKLRMLSPLRMVHTVCVVHLICSGAFRFVPAIVQLFTPDEANLTSCCLLEYMEYCSIVYMTFLLPPSPSPGKQFRPVIFPSKKIAF